MQRLKGVELTTSDSFVAYCGSDPNLPNFSDTRQTFRCQLLGNVSQSDKNVAETCLKRIGISVTTTHGSCDVFDVGN